MKRTGWGVVVCAAVAIAMMLGLNACSGIAGSGETRASADAATTPAGTTPAAVSTKKGTVPVSLHLPPLGLVMREMTPDERESRKLDHGVWVMVAVGASAIAGVRENDIILSVDKNPVRDVEQFWMQLDRANWQCTLNILRQDKRIDIDVGKTN